MSSNSYNPYSYPYQQSSTQQYSAYQTASAANNVAQPSRQYQQPPTTQAQDYMSYQPQSYANQNSGYGAAQDDSWGSSNYGETRETTRGAAEVLRNMSNSTLYTNNSAPTNAQSGFTATDTASAHTSRYAAGSSHSPQVQAQQPHAVYGQSQAPPRSVNNNRLQPAARGLPSPAMVAGYPSQRTQTMYNHQQQRSASPAQPQYNNAPGSSVRSAGMTATSSQQYGDYSARQLPSVEVSRNSQNATSSTAYNYGNAQISSAIAPSAPTPPAAMANTYSAQSTTTVDPMAVYDPWLEYQRKQAAQKAIEDAARVEEERIAKEVRKIEEQKKEEERKRKEEEEDTLRQSQPKPKVRKAQKQQASTREDIPAAASGSDGPADALESEIRAMMAKMRELNSKDPALLARIWEEERRAKVPKSPTAQNKPAPQSATPQPAEAAEPAQTATPQATNSRKKATPKPAANSNAPQPVIPAIVQAVPARQSQPNGSATRPTGNTVWPPEKKAHLARAAAAYINSQNDVHKVEPGQILNLLNSNPSYIQLCEQLEKMGLKLDRAVFAKSLLTSVPDVNSASRKPVPPAPVSVQRPPAPPAVMKKEVATPVVPSPQYALAAPSPTNRSPYPSFPGSASPVLAPAPVAEMVPIKPELRKPANKEEAARKRNLSDLVDLTQLSEEEDMGPPRKRTNADQYTSPYSHLQDTMAIDEEPSTPNFPIADTPSYQPQPSVPTKVPSEDLRYVNLVQPLDRKKALRRNTYNPATIARDVLLACGRHPSERNLNQHLDGLRTTLPQIGFDSDLSTLRWDRIDPGNPPPGYFKDGVQALTEDADDEEDDSGDESRAHAPSKAIGGEGGAAHKVQALPEAINPFKQKRRGRPPRHSFPDGAPATPKRPSSPASMSMSSSVPRPTNSAAGVGYQAFRSVTEYGPDGKPLPKKRGRPVGWRKAIHGSPAAQSHTSANRFTGPKKKQHQPTQPSTLRNEPIRISSRSPSVANSVTRCQSYKCKWQHCQADLHNLATLQKHIFKVHGDTLECLWDDCGKEVTNYDPMTNMSIERHQPHSFDLESNWRDHIQQAHISPLSWQLGDGRAAGLSDSHDSEAYLSDAQGRQVTPRITVDPARIEALSMSPQAPVGSGRGRPPKRTAEQEARDAHDRLVSLKKRIGGPGMDRGGVTLANDKRRRGFIESDETEEELVDIED
ncbi:hypothetical protein G6011_09800 [Alternaria panax]|uniref:C2H2-type domain-containing protein n=1 Tax=Alternaria panax TaxID=48097 RepID=A0AAD4FBF7_9PLEO|nr:hypothetical protein G6011_09800 [Alternaria panax]